MFTTQPPTIIRHKTVYTKSYHLVKGVGSNINGNSQKDIDLSEHISERLKKKAMLERRPRNGREGSHSGSSDYAALTTSSKVNTHPNQMQQIDQFIHRKKSKL